MKFKAQTPNITQNKKSFNEKAHNFCCCGESDVFINLSINSYILLANYKDTEDFFQAVYS